MSSDSYCIVAALIRQNDPNWEGFFFLTDNKIFEDRLQQILRKMNDSRIVYFDVPLKHRPAVSLFFLYGLTFSLTNACDMTHSTAHSMQHIHRPTTSCATSSLNGLTVAGCQPQMQITSTGLKSSRECENYLSARRATPQGKVSMIFASAFVNSTSILILFATSVDTLMSCRT